MENKLNLRVEITIYRENISGERLHLTEELRLGSDLEFFEIAQILGQFRELADKIKNKLTSV